MVQISRTATLDCIIRKFKGVKEGKRYCPLFVGEFFTSKWLIALTIDDNSALQRKENVSGNCRFPNQLTDTPKQLAARFSETHAQIRSPLDTEDDITPVCSILMWIKSYPTKLVELLTAHSVYAEM